MKWFWISAIIIFYVFFALFHKTSNIGFGGDDYLALMDYLRGTGNSWFTWKFFFWQYGPTDTIFGLVYRLLGFSNPTPFFMVSNFLRYLSSLVVSLFVYKITKHKLAALVSGLFWSIGYTGIETTSWVFNLSSYLAISLFLGWFYLWMGARKNMNYFQLLLSFLFFWLAIVSQPIRMTGLPIMAVVVSILFYKKVLWNLTSLILVFITIFSIFVVGNSLGTGNNWQERISDSLGNKISGVNNSVFGLIQSGNYKFLINPITQIGAVVFPDTEIKNGTRMVSEFPFRGDLTIRFVTWQIILLIFWKNKKKYLLITSLNLVWTIAIYFIFKSNQNMIYLASPVLSLIGGYTIILLLSITNNLYQLGLIFWLLIAFAVAWFRFPTEVQASAHRYLISSSVSLSLLIGMFISQAKTSKRFLVYLVLLLPLFSAHWQASNKYLMDLETYRNKEVTTRIRTSLPILSNLRKTSVANKPLVFYFKSENKKLLYHSLLFGLPAIMAVADKSNNYPLLALTDSDGELESLYLGKDALLRFGWPISPTPLENIFAYRIFDDGSIENISEEIRIKLSSLTK